MPPNSSPADPRAISTGGINSGGGPIAAGGNVYDQRTTVTQAPTTPTATFGIRPPAADFVGREAEIAALAAELTGGPAPGGAAICGVRGLGGLGKTELALVVVAQVAGAFPDGQVLLALHGAEPNPPEPHAALAAVIRAFAPDAARLPEDLAGLQSTYLTLLRGKRALILADDAAGPEQVRPLIPPPGCALLITSRRHFVLPGLHSHALARLPRADAVTLVQGICDRLTPAQAGELARLCGDLPLALRTAASLLAVEPQRSVPRYLRDLAGERTRLRALQVPDDRDLNVEASLLLSWAALSPVEEALLPQLSIFPAPFDLAAAVAVVDLHHGDTEARRTEEEETELEGHLGSLLRRSLLEYDAATEHYRLHELVRVFAAARLPDSDAARWRHARHYAAVAAQAKRMYLQGGDALMAGLALFDRERAHIDGAWEWVEAQTATSSDLADPLLINYADAMMFIWDLRFETGHQRIPHLEVALAAARRLGRQDAEGWFLGNLGLAYVDLGETQRAIAYYEQRLEIAHALVDRRGEGNVLGNLGNAYAVLGEPERAIGYYEQQLVIARAIGNRRGEGNALGNLGNCYRELGELERAAEYYEQVLNIARSMGDRQSEALACWNLGLLLEQQGDLARAVALMQVRVDFLQEIGHPRAEEHVAYLAEVRARLAAEG